MRAWSRGAVLHVAVLLLVAVTAACGGGGDDEDAGAATSASSAPSTSTTASAPSTTTTGAPRSTSTSAVSPKPSAAPSTTAATKTPRTTTTGAAPAPPDGGLTFFSLPSGNIGCSIDAGFGVRCDILEADWELPPRPASCPLDWIPGVVLGSEAQVGICAGDTAMGGTEVLDYDTSIRRGDYRCDSARTGVTCRNQATGAGFRLSRASVEVL